MKKRIQKGDTQNEISPTNTTGTLALTTEEIRERAHQVFLARGGAPGNELDDWLLAEQELKRERARANPQAQANRPHEDS